jgi:ribosomal protein L11 methylase PrmA
MSEGGHPASFRDPSGFLYERNSKLYRQVNRSYQKQYDTLMASGLYKYLTEKHWLIPHRETKTPPLDPELSYKTIQPDVVRYISYPYEWCFSQLQDAALLTLKILKAALRYGMTLKDASAYNMQFHEGRPVLVDTLSFETYVEGGPWEAYGQFCRHFLAPLALMAYTDVRLSQLMRISIDGIPLDLASRLLPIRSRLNSGLLLHLHIHAGMRQRTATPKGEQPRSKSVSKTAFLGLIESLQGTVRNLRWKPTGTEWAEYYEENNYTETSFRDKKKLTGEFLRRIQPGVVWDLGGNTGVFSRIAAAEGCAVVCFDGDNGAVEKNYLEVKARQETLLLPLVLDLTNPSPSLGWNHRERESFLQRGPADAVLALAIIHHLAIGNNLPLERVADFLTRCGQWLSIEFIPKEDSQVRKLLSTRKDIFTDYTRENFEAVFRKAYRIEKSIPIAESKRTLYLMRKKPLRGKT